MKNSIILLTELMNCIQGNPPGEALRLLAEKYPGKLVFTSSFGIEDQVITDMIARQKLHIRIISLDTGRLFEETYRVMDKTRQKYGDIVDFYFPDSQDIEKMLNQKGPFSFFESVENRKECCHLRKVKPLKRALESMDGWITGIRAEQSEGRTRMQPVEWDDSYGLFKFHPLFDWDLERVWQYIRDYEVPYNILHNKGFISIGCAPCTRAIREGENFRDGRWWWENDKGKECGLHR